MGLGTRGGQHRAREAFKTVLLPGETFIQLEPCRQGVEDRLMQSKLVCCCTERKK